MQEGYSETSEIVVFIFAGAFGFVLLCGFLIYFIMMYRRRQAEFEEQHALLRSQFEKAILRSELEIREQTLHYVATEIHDNIGQIAAVMRMNLSSIPKHPEESADNTLQDTKELLKRMTMDLKLLSKRLHSRYIATIGLSKAIELEVEQLKNRSDYQVEYHKEGSIPPLHEETGTVLFRIFQESLHNIIKHAKASQITMDVKADPQSLLVTIADNGVGFDNEKYAGEGTGLSNLQERCKLIGAQYSIHSIQGIGTTVSLKYVLPQSENL